MEDKELKIEDIIKEYLKPVYGLVFRLTSNKEEAEDLTQDVFVKVWKNLAKYNPRLSLKTWIFTITRNTVIDWYRQKKLLLFSELQKSWVEDDSGQDFADNLVDLEKLPDELFAQRELKQKLEKIVDQLSPDQKIVVLLHLEDGLIFEEIAKVVDRPLNTVKSQYRRALLKLRKLLDLSAPK